LKGNNTWQAARSLGWDEIPVTFIDVTDAEAARILLADNRLADKAGYYNASLASVLMDLDSLDGTGFEPADIEEIIKDLPQERDPIAAINAPADVRRVATIKVGGASIQVCGKQYSEWEQLMIADGFVSKEERGYRIGQLLTLDPSLFSVWASVADPTTGNNEFRK
jgi:ParB-like chromosome segregation protein Spo0J